MARGRRVGISIERPMVTLCPVPFGKDEPITGPFYIEMNVNKVSRFGMMVEVLPTKKCHVVWDDGTRSMLALDADTCRMSKEEGSWMRYTRVQN